METPDRSRFDAFNRAGADFPQTDPVPHNRPSPNPRLVNALVVGMSVALVLLLFLWRPRRKKAAPAVDKANKAAQPISAPAPQL